MSKEKKKVREAFRISVFERDGYKCRVCKIEPSVGVVTEGIDDFLDAHHITDRNLLPSGGYVKENGISLCPECHIKAEVYHSTGTAVEGYHPDDLYRLIKSSHEKAYTASLKL